MGISGGLTTLVELLSLFTFLGLFNVQISSHMFTPIVSQSFVQSFLRREFDETKSFRSTSVSISQDINTQNFCESVEEILDVLIRSIIR